MDFIMPQCKITIQFLCNLPDEFDKDGGEGDQLVNEVLESLDSISDNFEISKDIDIFIKEVDDEPNDSDDESGGDEEYKKIDISKMN